MFFLAYAQYIVEKITQLIILLQMQVVTESKIKTALTQKSFNNTTIMKF